MTNTEAKVRRYYCSDETGKLTTQPTKHGWHRVFVLESDHDAAIAALTMEVERLRNEYHNAIGVVARLILDRPTDDDMAWAKREVAVLSGKAP